MSDPFVKLSDVARKPSDILSDPSGIEVNSLSDQSVLVSDRTVTLFEVNVQRFYHHSVPVARKILPVARETVNFFLRAEMQFTIRLAMLPNLRQPCLPVRVHCADINLCSYLFSSQTDFKIIGHYHTFCPSQTQRHRTFCQTALQKVF